MIWEIRFSKNSAKELYHLPRDKQRRLQKAIEEMRLNPLRGNVRPIKTGKLRGALRKRVGHYRIIFAINLEKRLIEIAAILFRNDNTYN